MCFTAEISEQQKKLHVLKKEFGEQEKLYNECRRKHLTQVHRAKHEERKAAEEAHQLELYALLLLIYLHVGFLFAVEWKMQIEHHLLVDWS